MRGCRAGGPVLWSLDGLLLVRLAESTRAGGLRLPGLPGMQHHPWGGERAGRPSGGAGGGKGMEGERDVWE